MRVRRRSAVSVVVRVEDGEVRAGGMVGAVVHVRARRGAVVTSGEVALVRRVVPERRARWERGARAWRRLDVAAVRALHPVGRLAPGEGLVQRVVLAVPAAGAGGDGERDAVDGRPVRGTWCVRVRVRVRGARTIEASAGVRVLGAAGAPQPRTGSPREETWSLAPGTGSAGSLPSATIRLRPSTWTTCGRWAARSDSSTST